MQYPRLAPLLASLLFLPACSSEGGDAFADAPWGTELARGRRPRPEAGVAFGAVTATGTGCPEGSWLAERSEDGQTFTLAFAEYEASVTPGVRVARSRCHVTVEIRAAKDARFAVASFYYTGSVFLDRPGMEAEQTASYSFKGPAEATSEARVAFAGITNEPYVFDDTVEPRSEKASGCGKQGKLHIRTDLTVKNDPARSGSGFLNAFAVDGNLESRPTLRVRVVALPCE
jgi:hypothetical protein